MWTLLHYESFSLQSTNSVVDTVARLQNQTSAITFSSGLWFGTNQKFEGIVTEEGFVINQTRSWLNSLPPVLIGRFKATTTGTYIDVHIRPHRTNIVIAVVMLAGTSLGAPSDWMISAAIFLVCYAMFILPHNFEADQAKRLLQQILIAEVVAKP